MAENYLIPSVDKTPRAVEIPDPTANLWSSGTVASSSHPGGLPIEPPLTTPWERKHDRATLMEVQAMPDMTPSGPRPLRTYGMSRGRRMGNAIVTVFVRVGVVPSTYLMTTRGRKTGRLRTNPVTIVERHGRRWLVAPYGAVSWVHNARAAGRVTLRRRRETIDYAIREVTPEEAGPVLKQYIVLARPTRPYFRAAKDAPVEEFVAEADQHPVFELTPAQ